MHPLLLLLLLVGVQPSPVSQFPLEHGRPCTSADSVFIKTDNQEGFLLPEDKPLRFDMYERYVCVRTEMCVDEDGCAPTHSIFSPLLCDNPCAPGMLSFAARSASSSSARRLRRKRATPFLLALPACTN
eukprot:m.552021 g.552021  ORF g.552021 m.552021 type:complete len:129 (+) comp57737_c2_seq9:1144-1530(+)